MDIFWNHPINDEGNGHGGQCKITFSARSWSAPPEIAGFCFQGFVLIRANDRLRKHHCLYKKKLGFSRPTLGWPRTKMLLVPNVFLRVGRLCSGWYCLTEQMWFLKCCLFRSERSWHAYSFSVVLFKVGKISPLMQGHFLWPLLKRAAL